MTWNLVSRSRINNFNRVGSRPMRQTRSLTRLARAFIAVQFAANSTFYGGGIQLKFLYFLSVVNNMRTFRCLEFVLLYIGLVNVAYVWLLVTCLTFRTFNDRWGRVGLRVKDLPMNGQLSPNLWEIMVPTKCYMTRIVKRWKDGRLCNVCV